VNSRLNCRSGEKGRELAANLCLAAVPCPSLAPTVEPRVFSCNEG
jgi:hypothetical protein